MVSGAIHTWTLNKKNHLGPLVNGAIHTDTHKHMNALVKKNHLGPIVSGICTAHNTCHVLQLQESRGSFC